MTEHNILKMESSHVYKSFGEVKVLQDVSVKVHEGEVVALIGPSGAGKSTFLRCVNNLYPIDSGTVEIDGELIGYRKVGKELHELSDKEAAKQRAKVGMVFQNFNLFRHMTALDNVVYGQVEVLKTPRRQAREVALDYLAKVGLEGKEDRFPAQLSGGQQQRVAIARALAMEPAMILLDEPTSALDPELRVEVAAVIKGMAENNRTMLMATHDIPLVREIADYIIFMVEGRILEAGSAEKLLNDPEHERTRTFLARMSE
ncbi:amino acid ABC transporter ATP-binding protein [Microbacterium sp.]|uniref:amino acid ABC transporter ATP-binding protein n=1 Tax=Microbacterium sp. TaxID=51671 RepID=UPI0028122F77|nr:amino acid ABC transporter ATP-binding protein [Microbacterium sp.]